MEFVGICYHADKLRAAFGGVRLGFGLLGLVALGAFAAPPAYAIDAANGVAVTSEGRLGRIVIRVNHSQTIRLPAPYADVLVGASDIADVLPVSEKALYVLGKKIGTTNVTVFDADKKLIGILDIQVTPDLRAIETRIRAAAPGARRIKVSNAGERLVLNGVVPDAPTAERVVAIASAFSGGQVVNALEVASPQQVLLEVRVVEASRNAGRELGVKWDWQGRRSFVETGVGSGRVVDNEGRSGVVSQLLSGSTPFGAVFANVLRASNVSLDVQVQALEEKGLVRRLASPNLTALSGSTANFLAGGEFPIPVGGQANDLGGTQTQIVFKKFGVMLDFTPVVLENGSINLRITPEVSELDFGNAIRNLNITIPAIVVRRASTEIVLKSGQSFAIAGLLSQTGRTEAAQLPWVGSIPILGALFRSQAFQRSETELVILVTAHLARPAVPGETLATPFDKTLPANDLDFFADGKFEILKDYRNYVERGEGVVGPYGHVIDLTRGGQPRALATRY